MMKALASLTRRLTKTMFHAVFRGARRLLSQEGH
jgi:hypothetical protein